jgi:hypothetical protein
MGQANKSAALLAMLVCTGCSSQHAADIVGIACLPEVIPTSSSGEPGYSSTETYLSSSAECGLHACVVHHLDNGTEDKIPADPRLVCDARDPKPGCVEASAVAASVHCTCRCDGPERNVDYCTCPEDFACREVLPSGPEDVQGSYCVKRPTPPHAEQ